MENAIFLSASVPTSREEKYLATADPVAIAAAVSALVFVVLGRRPLVWGGHPAITPMIWAVAAELKVDYGGWVKLYQSRFFKDQFPEDNANFRNVTYTEAVGRDEHKSLLLMRRQMFRENTFSAAVFIGGMSGVWQEFELFTKKQKTAAVVPLASTGGASMEVAERVGAQPDLYFDLDYVPLLHAALGISVREKRRREPGISYD